jgi:hypothetical protein
VFRLTESEYALLRQACQRVHCTISEYARVELLSAVCAQSRINVGLGGSHQVSEALSQVQNRLEELKELLLCDRKGVKASETRGGGRQR